MNKAEFVSHVAAETSTSRAAAERMVGAPFSVIADALARDEPVAIAGLGKLAVRGRSAPPVRGAIPEPGNRSPYRRRKRRRSSPESPSRRGQRIA